MANKKDCYEILGLKKGATIVEIKSAYKKLALKYHPDKNKDNSSKEKFQEITEAYNTLSDPKKKEQYDRFGSGFEGDQGFSGFSQGSHGGFSGFDDLGDIFGEMFGFGGGKKKNNSEINGRDIQINMQLTLEEVFTGLKKDVSFDCYIHCSKCDGRGFLGKPTKCKTCNGAGMIQSSIGFMYVSQTCGTCMGQGSVQGDNCHYCSSYGRINGKKTVNIQIPKSVKNGDNILLRGSGEAGGRGGNFGNLHINIQVIDHKIFKRDGNDLIIDYNFSLKDIILGGNFTINGIDGEQITFTLQESFSPSEKIIISGKGLYGNFSRGKLIINSIIKMPKLNSSSKKKFEEIFSLIN